jgi:CHAT domain-containing protein/tetratricopeptide (TPR) repeat protein
MRLIILLFFFSALISLKSATAQTLTKWDSLYNFIQDTLIKKQHYEQAYSLSQKNLQNTNPKEYNYFLNTHQIGEVLFYKTEYQKGIDLLRQTNSLIKTTPFKDSILSSKTLSLLGLHYRRNKEDEKAEKAYLEAYNELIKFEKTSPSSLSTCAFNLAVLYREMGKTDESIEFCQKALSLTPKKTEIYNSRYSLLSLLYKRKGQFKEALQIAQEVLAKTDTSQPQYLLRLMGLGYLYGEIRVMDKAMALGIQAANIVEKRKGKNDIEYANYASGLSLLNARLGHFKIALDYAQHACKITENKKENTDYYFYLGQQASCLLELGDAEKALPLALEARTALGNKHGKKSEQYIMTLNTLSRIYEKKGDFQEALKINEEQLELIKSAWSDKDEAYILAQMHAIELYNATKNPAKSIELLKNLAHAMNNKVLYNLDVLDEYSKEIFIANFISNYEPLLFSQIKNASEPDAELIKLAYEAELSIKGVILSSTQIFQKIAKNTKNVIARNEATEGGTSLEKWTQLKDKISKSYTRNASQKQIDSLNNQLSQLEEKMIASMPDLQSFQRKTTRFEDVKNALKPDACAIEFVRFKHHNGKMWTDSVLYGALVVQPNQANPNFIYLCTEKELAEATSYALQYRLIWQPLEPFFKAVKTVHFAPAGLLHQVPFAALPVNDTTVLSDIFQLNTLSSSRELVKNISDFKPENIHFFGGIQYGESPKNPTNKNTPWGFLEGTKYEIDRISTLCKAQNIPFQITEGFSATEEVFKNSKFQISNVKTDTPKLKTENSNLKFTEGGASPQIWHLATHGFFYQNTNDSLKTLSAFQSANNPLIRSGLILAGANAAWQGENPQDGKEDGILTAFEISQMDLSKTHLVVLSACETGLGDVQGSEGVYGLQRAFKMAGVEYLLMSLWQVPDKQTAELMEQFYTHLLNGVSMQEAFSKAQQSMKERYTPFYWAGFVLMR